MRRRHLLRGLAAAPLALPGLAGAQGAWPATWPTRPVRIINPYSPGGTTDIAARLLTDRLERAFGQPFLLESRPGAGGSVGTAAVAAATDFHTLATTNTGPLAVAPTMLPNLAYDPTRAFTFITMFGGAPILAAVKAGSPIRTLADLIAAARARPESISYGNSGTGSVGHLAALVFEQATGIRMLHVPFRGAPEAQAAVLSGDTVMLWDTIGAHAGSVRQGALQPLALTSAQRLPIFPEVPTAVEQGFPGVVVSNWFLLAAPAAMPADLARRINAVCQEGMKEAAVAERLAGLGLGSLGNPSPEEILEFVKQEGARWAPIVRGAGITG
ncbi:Bug family tripartite tricarboxylate transporter substrate binding protein [Paracraurococcus ruber]|nr:tripartite tricarboxylate transporter substrate binding protein [Paracraurococcus ruber]